MSMLSAQINRLRSHADLYDGTTKPEMSKELQRPYLAQELREAADTILSLRDRAQDLQAHNAKLRKERDMYRDLVGMMDHPDLNAQLQAENDRLRELAVLNWEWAHSCCGNNCKMHTNDCGYQIDRDCNYEREIWDRMRELGVDA